MAVEFVRLVRSPGGLPRLCVAGIDALLVDRRAVAIDRGARFDASPASPFERAFVTCLAPYALSSRLWTASWPVLPSSLHEGTCDLPELPDLARLGTNLSGAHRSLRRSARRTLRNTLVDDVHRTMTAATQRAQLGGLRRTGEMVFRCGSIAYLMPHASDIARQLKTFASTWRTRREILQAVGPLVAALHLSLVHPFVNGNGRMMRAFAVAFGRDDASTLCNVIACFMQGRQRLWNYTLQLALDGDRNALWDHFEISLACSRELRGAMAETVARYRERTGLRDTDIRGVHDAALVGSVVLNDRNFRRFTARASRRTADAMREVYVASASVDGTMQWTNSGATALVDGLTGPLMRHI